MDLTQYDYNLPDELIARVPIEPRDSSRLLVYDTSSDTVTLDTFINLDRYLPQKSLLIFNDTKVLPARLNVYKPTGGRVELLLLVNEFRPDDKYLKGLSDRKIEVGQILTIDDQYNLTVAKQDEKIFYFQLNFDRALLPDLLFQHGVTPIPKYLSHSPTDDNQPLDENALRLRYQSMFAEKPASVAAPTASLHFTKAVMDKLTHKNIGAAHVTLHVGLGTFAPISQENIDRKQLHEEWYEIDAKNAQLINSAKQNNAPVIAVGTTTIRAVESSPDKILNGGGEIKDKTSLFIYPPYNFKIADGLITNFHLPQSSLMCLVDAFLQNKKARKPIAELYRIAIKNSFRFYSFGDCMLII